MSIPRVLAAAAISIVWVSSSRGLEPAAKIENVIIVTLDGFRWQELFEGGDSSFMDLAQGVRDVDGLKKRYLRDTSPDRREALMPFVWGTVAKKGQIFGNPGLKATTKSTNGLKFSYPGYSEMFCGVADPRIDSNAKRANPNLSVLEFLNGRPGFQNRVETACTWDVFPSIFRAPQSKLRVHAGWEPLRAEVLTERERALNDTLAMLPRYWPDNSFDVLAMGAAWSALERRKPRVLFIGLGETDEWGHGRRYDLYLEAANKADRFLADLWAWLQNQPQYRDKTALLLTTDHGRGSTRVDWISHGKAVPGAENIWIAVIGPGIPALGERQSIETTQSQIAATIAALVGEDFTATIPKAAKPLPLFTASEKSSRVTIETEASDIEVELARKLREGSPTAFATWMTSVTTAAASIARLHPAISRTTR